jgi:hypothetical protein
MGPAAKPVAARRWRDKVKAIIRDAMAKNNLFIRVHPNHHIGGIGEER